MDLAELREALATVSLDTPGAVHSLLISARALMNASRNTDAWPEAAELMRRAERAMGLAIRRAQKRGTVLKPGQHPSANPTAVSPNVYVNKGGEASFIYSITDAISDELFEQAITQSKDRLCSRMALLDTLRVLRGQEPKPPKAPKPVVDKPTILPTRRGTKTVEHMAIQLNAIAMGLMDLEPEEVDPVANRRLIFQAFEDVGTIRTFLKKVNKNV